MFAIACLNPNDDKDIVDKKIKIVTKYIDIFSSIRVFNFAKINWNTNKYDLFNTIKNIRGLSLAELTTVLTCKLIDMDLRLDAIVDNSFGWNQFTGKYILHILARFTDYVETEMGNESLFDSYVNRSVKNSYDREHVLPDKYEDYKDEFSSLDEFNTFRWKIGNLILLKLDKNRSYQDMKYDAKKKLYLTNNILAQSFNEDCYKNNPKFERFILEHGFNLKPYNSFGKQGINDRQKLYQDMAIEIWNFNGLKKISNEWDENLEKEIFAKKLANSISIDLLSDRLDKLTHKKPFLIDIQGYCCDCTSFVDMALKILEYLYQLDSDKMVLLAKSNFDSKLNYVEGDETRTIKNGLNNGKVLYNNLIVEMNASAKSLGMFIKDLLNEYNISSCIIYLK